jgi:hypothetical protein
MDDLGSPIKLVDWVLAATSQTLCLCSPPPTLFHPTGQRWRVESINGLSLVFLDVSIPLFVWFMLADLQNNAKRFASVLCTEPVR